MSARQPIVWLRPENELSNDDGLRNDNGERKVTTSSQCNLGRDEKTDGVHLA